MVDFKKAVEGVSKLGTLDLDQSRGHDLNRAMVDVVKRENEEGKFNLNILVYVRPDLRPEPVKAALKKTCQNLFGKSRGKDEFETFFRTANSVELATGEKGVFDCFDITIKYPTSMNYSVEGLKGVFNVEFNRNLNAVK